MKIEDRLVDLTADLVEREENQAFLERLFALEASLPDRFLTHFRIDV